MFLQETVRGGVYDVRDIVRRFGTEHVKRCLSNKVYRVHLPEDTTDCLIAARFHKKAINTAKKNLKAGHPIKHLVKSSGAVKKNARSVKAYIDSLSLLHSFRNRIILSQLFPIFKRAYLNRFRDIDTTIDPLTCEKIGYPVYIREDWKNGCKVVYDISTVMKCRIVEKIPWRFEVVNGEDVMYYISSPTDFFVSPFTRFKFTYNSIISLYV